MPISPATIQRRFAELGRIRLGAKAGGNGRPMKLAAFRFTSPNERYINDLAALYGGTPQPWDNNNKPEHEVFTDATSIPVVAMKGGLSQWMETWSGGGCVHRCDGERDAATGELCNPDDRAHRDAKPTTRLSLMLPELEALGAWRMESHGWNAAAELPAVAELAQFVGDLVPAHLTMVERRSVKDGKTSRFVVPVLDLQIGAARLREIVAEKSGTAPALEPPAGSGGRPALEAPAPVSAPVSAPAEQSAVKIPTPEQIAAFDLDTARKALAYLDRNAPDHPARDAVYDRVADLEPSPDEDGVVDAVVVEEESGEASQDGEADQVWQQVLAAGGQQGLNLDALTNDFSERMGGLIAADATATELRHYLGLLTGERAA